MSFMPSRRLRQLSIDIGWTPTQYWGLLRTISLHLNYPENRLGLEGILRHGQAWEIWLKGFLEGPLLDEAWEGGKQIFWNEIKGKDIDNAKTFLRIASKEAGASVRNYLRKGRLLKPSNDSVESANPERNLSFPGYFIDEQDSGADGNSVAAEEVYGEGGSITKTEYDRNLPQSTLWEPFSPELYTTPVNFGRRTSTPYHFSFQSSEGRSTEQRFAAQSIEEIAPGKPREVESSNPNQALAVIGMHSRQKRPLAVTATPLQFPVRCRPVTFMARLQIPNTDVVRYESIDVDGVMALQTFITTLRSVHGMLNEQYITCLDIQVDGRTINVDVGDEDSEWEWGTVLGIAHFSGVPDEEPVFVDILTEYRECGGDLARNIP